MANGRTAASWRRKKNIPRLTPTGLAENSVGLRTYLNANEASHVASHPSWCVVDGDLSWAKEYEQEITDAADDVYNCPQLEQVRLDVESTLDWKSRQKSTWHRGKLTTSNYQLQVLERMCTRQLDIVLIEAGGEKMSAAHDESVFRKDYNLTRRSAELMRIVSDRCAYALAQRLQLPVQNCQMSFEVKEWNVCAKTVDKSWSANLFESGDNQAVLSSQLLEPLRAHAMEELRCVDIVSLIPHLSASTLLDLFAARSSTEKAEIAPTPPDPLATAEIAPTLLNPLATSPCTPVSQALTATVPNLPGQAPTSEPKFFEKQEFGLARCGLHALNNVIGWAGFSADDMSRACDLFIAESKIPDKEGGQAWYQNRSEHEREGGWYSSEVLGYALRGSLRYQFVPVSLTTTSISKLNEPSCVGALVHHVDPTTQEGLHWTCLRREGDLTWDLDSCKHPILLSQSGVLKYVAEHAGKIYPVICIGVDVVHAQDVSIEVLAAGHAPVEIVDNDRVVPAVVNPPEDVCRASGLVDQKQKRFDDAKNVVRVQMRILEGHEKALADLTAQSRVPGATAMHDSVFWI